MFNPFTEHFWRHVWTPWSEPKQGIITLTDSMSGSRCEYIERKCTVCGKIDREIL